MKITALAPVCGATVVVTGHQPLELIEPTAHPELFGLAPGCMASCFILTFFTILLLPLASRFITRCSRDESDVAFGYSLHAAGELPVTTHTLGHERHDGQEAWPVEAVRVAAS
ncbi:MAG: hypothetical protein ABI386_00725 [Rhodanobacter sp.]